MSVRGWLLWTIPIGMVACKGQTSAPIQPDPVVPAPKPAPSPTPVAEASRVLFQGRVVDLKARSLLRVLEKDRPRHEAEHGDLAYLAYPGELRAYDMNTGAKRWTAPLTCDAVAAGPGGAFCGTSTGVVRCEPKTGAATTVSVKPATQLLAIQGRILGAHVDKTLDVWDATSGAAVGSSTMPFIVYGPREGFVANAKGACATSTGKELELFCVDATAKTVLSRSYPLAKPTDTPGTWFTRRQLDSQFAVASTWFGKGTRRGVVVRVTDGVELARLEEELVAAIGSDLIAERLLVTQPSTKLLDPSGKVRWTSTEKLNDAAAALQVGRAIVVSSYHPIATGADLWAFDKTTGSTLWKGDVSLLPIAHSKYSNHVELSLAFDHLMLRGTEAGQVYLELFDPKDGTRKFETVLANW